MSIQRLTLKRLYAKSGNRCAMPKCPAPIILGEIQVGEICHIKARSKKGPRYDAALTPAENDAYPNLILLCRTCHKLVDSDQKTYTADLLADIKEIHEKEGSLEITPDVVRGAELLMPKPKRPSRTSASATGNGISVAIGRDNHGPITVNVPKSEKTPKSKYPPNSIGYDANLGGYIDYLFGLGLEYWENVPTMPPGRIGTKIKKKFGLKTRTRLHLGVQRFQDLVDFIVEEILKPSPAGKRHLRQGTKLCRTFDEWRHGK